MKASLQPGSHPNRQYVHMQPTAAFAVPNLVVHAATGIDPAKWPTTIITGPLVAGKYENYARLCFHVVVWVVALGLACTAGFGIQGDSGFLEPDDDVNGTVSNSSYILSPSDTTKYIGMTSALCLIFGFLFMLASASVWDFEYFQEWGWPNVALQTFTNYAFVGQLHILIHAAAVPENDFFGVSLSACVFTGYLVVLLYCISASLDFLMLPRGFIPSLAISFQLVNYQVIEADEGGAPPGGYTDEQKEVALALVLVNAFALIIMVALRLWTRESAMVDVLKTDYKKQDLGDFPFFRSIVLTMYTAAAALSVYEWSFTSGANPGVWCFSALSVFTQFLIMAVIFYPSSAAAGGILAKDRRAYPNIRGTTNMLKSVKPEMRMAQTDA